MARIEIFLVWESNCRNILDELASLPNELLDEIKLRIFMRKDTPMKNRPPTAKWIELFDSFTTSPYASDTTLAAFLIKYFKDLAFLSDEPAEDATSENGFEPVEFYFVVDSDTERKYDELIAILQQDAGSKVKMSTINGQVEDIPKTLGFQFCKICCKTFENEGELKAHNGEYHNIFCDNKLCPKSNTPFKNEDELAAHKAKQTTCLLCSTESPVFCEKSAKILHMQVVHEQDITEGVLTCDFCPKKAFSSHEQHDIHMKNTHKKCNCGCGVYFETREHYLAHFYVVYPLACFENRKCPHRFQTVLHQADHHWSKHNSQHPYYCVPCSARDENGHAGGLARMCAFKDEKALRHHGALMQHAEVEMFLTQESSQHKPTAKSSAINYC
ncbi:uncharacterized protein LOC114534622 [Dendronephthya gigantea]|uniref:uncharacterized protein LOC114534622 n=1 Tax=Dendronephthya gigantea TaxID=151771 RepID=UPI001069C4F9|nr:uncharacterized protein LOC114534622 [Dendronephthya gigantea]